jgi:hypothetical protein
MEEEVAGWLWVRNLLGAEQAVREPWQQAGGSQ